MNANRLTKKTLEAFQNAQSICTAHQNNAIEPIHLLVALMQQPDGLIPQLMQRIGVNTANFRRGAEQAVSALPHVTGSGRKPGRVYVSKAPGHTDSDICLEFFSAGLCHGGSSFF